MTGPEDYDFWVPCPESPEERSKREQDERAEREYGIGFTSMEVLAILNDTPMPAGSRWVRREEAS